jgi:hypothetical protein
MGSVAFEEARAVLARRGRAQVSGVPEKSERSTKRRCSAPGDLLQ